jgi:hypothetical protein
MRMRFLEHLEKDESVYSGTLSFTCVPLTDSILFHAPGICLRHSRPVVWHQHTERLEESARPKVVNMSWDHHFMVSLIFVIVVPRHAAGIHFLFQVPYV